MTSILTTDRLILRSWQNEDVELYFLLNQEDKVTEFLPAKLTHEQAEQFIHEQNSQQKNRGYSFWAVELKNSGALIGFIGLNYVTWESPFTPATEIAWRLASKYWGQGYASEGAKAALNFAFEKLNLTEIIAFTVPGNKRSLAVMQRIGMQHDEVNDFLHPKLPPDHPLAPHLLYRIRR